VTPKKPCTTKSQITSIILFRSLRNFRYIISGPCPKYHQSFKSVWQKFFVLLALQTCCPNNKLWFTLWRSSTSLVDWNHRLFTLISKQIIYRFVSRTKLPAARLQWMVYSNEHVDVMVRIAVTRVYWDWDHTLSKVSLFDEDNQNETKSTTRGFFIVQVWYKMDTRHSQ